ncbi:hypothetical protein [Saccharopolyspora hattusasensis]|uniref:hypothetical protein n=1 Tax=Saccharopolyspora hattusasensis TaxID=1128679 RepID=UPI003D99EB0D
MLDTTSGATTESALEILQTSGMVRDHHTCYSMPHAIQEHARTLANHDDQHTRKAAQARVIALAYLPAAVDADYALNPRPPRYNPAYEELRSGARTSRFGHPREAMTWFTTQWRRPKSPCKPYLAARRALFNETDEPRHALRLPPMIWLGSQHSPGPGAELPAGDTSPRCTPEQP